MAVSGVAVLFGGFIWFVTFLSRIPQSVELVCEITPSSSGNQIAFLAYHGGYDDKWVGVRDFIGRHTGRYPYPDSVRLMLLDTPDGKTVDLGPGDLGSGTIAWAKDASLLAFVSGDVHPSDDRKRVKLFETSNGRTAEAFVGSDWYIQSLCFSPDSTSLAFVENYNTRNLTVLDVDGRSTTVLASGLNGHCLQWSIDGNSVFCIRNGVEIWELGVNGKLERLLFRGKDMDDPYPYMLVPSPDGTRLGFGYAGAFHSLDLATKKVEKWFDCDHYFITFDWSDDGICYLDAVKDERVKLARVMIHDPVAHDDVELAVGPYARVAWLRNGELALRKNNAEVWELTIANSKTKRLFPFE
ncbi:WD40 repeat domain-containing protein [Pirellulales bacterium]|nr:WD40 repeat domain-containing protein [Pirellulales bacterium]